MRHRRWQPIGKWEMQRVKVDGEVLIRRFVDKELPPGG